MSTTILISEPNKYEDGKIVGNPAAVLDLASLAAVDSNSVSGFVSEQVLAGPSGYERKLCTIITTQSCELVFLVNENDNPEAEPAVPIHVPLGGVIEYSAIMDSQHRFAAVRQID